MANLNITQAARQWGIARSTLQRAVKRGDISLTASENGMKYIDSSEMMRVYGEALGSSAVNLGVASDTHGKEIKLLREQIQTLNRLIERQDQFIEEKEKVIESQRHYISAFFKRLAPIKSKS